MLLPVSIFSLDLTFKLSFLISSNLFSLSTLSTFTADLLVAEHELVSSINELLISVVFSLINLLLLDSVLSLLLSDSAVNLVINSLFLLSSNILLFSLRILFSIIFIFEFLFWFNSLLVFCIDSGSLFFISNASL